MGLAHDAARSSDLLGIVRARAVSRATMRNIRQSLFFAFDYNVAGTPLAAGVLYPLFGVMLSLLIWPQIPGGFSGERRS